MLSSAVGAVAVGNGRPVQYASTAAIPPADNSSKKRRRVIPIPRANCHNFSLPPLLVSGTALFFDGDLGFIGGQGCKYSEEGVRGC